MDATILPTWVSPAPHHIGDGRHGKILADQWRTFCTVHLVITLVRLWAPLHPSHRMHQLLLNFMHLVTASKLMTMRSTSNERIDLARFHWMEYLKGLLSLFPDIRLSPSQHMTTHLPQQMSNFGPSHSTWSFVFERVNYLLQQINTDSRLGKQMLHASFWTLYLLSLPTRAA